MITFVQGMLVEKQPTRVVVEAGGIGYEIFIPLSSYDKLPVTGTACRLLSYDHVREDQRVLYGFHTEAERSMFELLLGVTGIGPKIALGILSGISLRELASAIGAGDIGRLGSVPGIGRKKAERIVVELREKIGATEGLAGGQAGAAATPEDTNIRDAMLALVSLGYKQNEAAAMVRKVVGQGGKPGDVEELVRRSLAGA